MSTSTSTFELNNYSITVSLGERNIYIKFIDQINFTNFEANLNAKELGLNFELPEIYKLICDTFSKEKDYLVIVSIENGFMKLLFHILVSGFLTIKFQALLKEKILSNDSQLTINFNKLEQKYSSLLTKMNKMEEKMMRQNEEIISLLVSISNAEINLSISTNFTPSLIFPINSKNISILNDHNNPVNYSKINLFNTLEKLEIINCRNFTSISALGDNKTVKELIIITSEINSLIGIQLLPNLVKLTIKNSPQITKIVDILSSVKHKINQLIIDKCPQVNSVELQNYCQINSINLNIS